MPYSRLVRFIFGAIVPLTPHLSRDTLLRLITRPKPEHPNPPDAVTGELPDAPAPPIDRLPGEKCSQFLIGGGYVMLFEILPDHTAGEILAIPVDEFSPERAEKFERYVRRKQLRKRMQLVR